jgi:hypothetical protein
MVPAVSVTKIVLFFAFCFLLFFTVGLPQQNKKKAINSNKPNLILFIIIKSLTKIIIIKN